MQDDGFSLIFHSLSWVTIYLVSAMVISKKEMKACLDGVVGDPHAWLGLHLLGDGKGVVARALDPEAETVSVMNLLTQSLHPMKCLDRNGFF